MSNPFEDESAEYLALSNQEGEFSLWPAALPIPPGWSRQHGPDRRDACLAHIEAHWTDPRPESLRRGVSL